MNVVTSWETIPSSTGTSPQRMAPLYLRKSDITTSMPRKEKGSSSMRRKSYGVGSPGRYVLSIRTPDTSTTGRKLCWVWGSHGLDHCTSRMLSPLPSTHSAMLGLPVKSSSVLYTEENPQNLNPMPEPYVYCVETILFFSNLNPWLIVVSLTNTLHN